MRSNRFLGKPGKSMLACTHTNTESSVVIRLLDISTSSDKPLAPDRRVHATRHRRDVFLFLSALLKLGKAL